MAERLKIYEQKKKGWPAWTWILPLLLLLGLLVYAFTHHRGTPPKDSSASPQTNMGAIPATATNFARTRRQHARFSDQCGRIGANSLQDRGGSTEAA